MLKKFQNHIDRNFPLLKVKKLFLAVSGGIDSMVLVHLLQQLHFNIAVLHCNFSLRASESDGDEQFVKSTCNHLNIPVFTQRFDTKQLASDYKLSIQLAARKLRYDWFYEQLSENNFDYIVTAHHLDDSLETFLINLSRGTGLDGLMGIPAQNDKILRLLLPFSREEIETYASENAVKWREDSSNASDKYLRNKLRHDVIPTLKQLHPKLLTSFQATLKNLQQSQSLVHDASRLIYKNVVTEQEDQIKINLEKLMQLPNYQAYLYQWLKKYNFTAWEDIYDLVHSQPGKQIFASHHTLLKDRDNLLLFATKAENTAVEYQINVRQKDVKVPLKLSICPVDGILEPATNVIFVDESKIHFPLTIRKWKEGDYFYPFGMEGKKKVSKFFKDEKLTLIDKSNQWLLCSKNEIVWIINFRLDNRFKVTTNTTNILKISTIK